MTLSSDSSFEIGFLGDGVLRLFEVPQEAVGHLSDKVKEVLNRAVSLRDGPLLLWFSTRLLQDEVPAGIAFVREVAKEYFSALVSTGEGALSQTVEAFINEKLIERLMSRRPPFEGSESFAMPGLLQLLNSLHAEVRLRFINSGISFGEFLVTLHPSFGYVGRICFHLAENRTNVEKPFAFLATYVAGTIPDGKWQYRPIGLALKEFAADGHRQGLVGLLKPIDQAANRSTFLKRLVDSKEVFQPLPWTVEEAYAFLKDVPVFESSGIITRIPDWWNAARRLRPQIKVEIGETVPSTVGINGLLGFSVKHSLGPHALTSKEWDDILNAKPGLVKIKGQWVEVDPEKLKQVLQHWNRVQRETEGFSFLDGMRLLAGFPKFANAQGILDSESEFLKVEAGDWLKTKLASLRCEIADQSIKDVKGLVAELRPYQSRGVAWLWQANQLGMGVCLADDMGLGKTIQILSLCLLLKEKQKSLRAFVVVPASLVGNWVKEVERFAPSLSVFVLHSSFGAVIGNEVPKGGEEADIILTTYGTLHRAAWLKTKPWDLYVVDEAQAIKNPGTRQSIAVKAVPARQKIAMTGTPVENRLADLWSIFDFVAPGLLGKQTEFSEIMKGATSDEGRRYKSLRTLVSPYILRRLKTDRSIINDLPDKTETNTYCFLSKEQAALYRASVDELIQTLKVTEGIKRKGQVLAFLLRFKQICNHPSQWTGDGAYEVAQSGKFLELKRIVADILDKREKVLIFTQFREIGAPLSSFLKREFGVASLLLTGETSIKKRKEMVESFQSDNGPPVFVLSVKAGGTGLNLTAASHVIHFDRWWNPAVENQATDRAFRIGQKRNVLVHKFVCRGTIEERIDAMIQSKSKLASELLEGGGEISLTEMSDDEILNLVTLDIKQVAVD